ncbi:MAG: hypothetical protein H6981_12130 [Gammaproteobacteria bacterium]|nr:hypothetical protein [Gammaproteobacteria bacterium]MCP5137537.1 hypothetical protein [Gammaproteobacteria bacterium]
MRDKTLFSLDMGTDQRLLSDWHANPIPAQMARDWLRDNYHRSHSLNQLIARFWADLPCDLLREELIRDARHDGQKALIDLAWGQLLIARRLNGAMGYLNQGFHLAVPMLSARAYLRVLKRHQTLSWLIVGRDPASALTLDELLRLAEVTRRMRAANGEDARFQPDASHRRQLGREGSREDTVG